MRVSARVYDALSTFGNIVIVILKRGKYVYLNSDEINIVTADWTDDGRGYLQNVRWFLY